MLHLLQILLRLHLPASSKPSTIVIWSRISCCIGC
jgi:hypothetical protein